MQKQSQRFVNLTRRPVVVFSGPGEVITIPPSGAAARLNEVRGQPNVIDGVPVVTSSFTLPDLRPPQDGVFLIVPFMVATFGAAHLGRTDLAVPGDLIYGPDGRVIGATCVKVIIAPRDDTTGSNRPR